MGGGGKMKKSVIQMSMILPLIILFCFFGSCQPTTQNVTKGERARIEKTILQVTDDLASSISRLDVEGVVRLFSDREGSKYISDGVVIPYKELKEKLGQFYGSLKKMDFVNEKKEVRVLDSEVTVLTTWVNYRTVAGDDQKMEEKAIFSLVYVHQDGEWKIFQAHKSLIR
jgi:hypothetical protein